MNLQFIRKLPIPMELKEKYPLSEELSLIVRKRDTELKNILSSNDKRFIIIVGPCSADNVKSVLEYCERLKKLYEKVKEKIYIIPRIYTSKPRTNSKGYKGLLHQPDPNGVTDMLKGLINVRTLHMKVLEETGLTAADELLYSQNYKYIDDIICYSVVGARSVEDQEHRLVASGISVPVGMKNPTSGDLSVLLKSILAAQSPHQFIYRGWEVESKGNPYAHAILRGYSDVNGKMIPNYGRDSLEKVCDMYEKFELHNKALIVDCNHSNSAKDFDLQPKIALDIIKSYKEDNTIKKYLKGIMIESYLLDGKQEISSKEYGKSITDACLGWEKTERLILDIAELV